MSEVTKAKLSLILVNLLFASCLLVTKSLVDVYPMYLLTAMRFFIASICLLIMYHNKLKNIDKGTVVCGFFIGIVYVAGIILQTLGIKYTTAGRTSFLTTFYCILVPFFAWFVFKKRPSTNKFIAAILGIIGVGFVVLTERLTVSAGDLFTLSAAVLFAVYILLIDIYVKKFNPELFNIFLFLCCAIVTFIMSLSFETMPTEFDLSPIFGVLYLAVMCSAIPLLIQSKAQKIVDPSFIAIMVGPQAMFTTIFSVILFHEPITIKNLIGFALILIAVFIGAK